MHLESLYQKAAAFGFLTVEEGVFLYHHAPLTDLMFIADELRKKQVPHGKVTWQIDRNVNTTNVCIANCKFCNFYRIPGHAEAYITDMPAYRKKIEETIKYGGDQLLLQVAIIPNWVYNFMWTHFDKSKKSFRK
jgi:cyclic dehypoxanthinyl futalosine synthase